MPFTTSRYEQALKVWGNDISPPGQAGFNVAEKYLFSPRLLVLFVLQSLLHFSAGMPSGPSSSVKLKSVAVG